MPSESVMVASDTVWCRMVNDKLPLQMCDEEQNSKACRGCTAASRRCMACGVARGITDAENGWCEQCAAKGGSVERGLAFEETTDRAITRALDRVRLIAAPKTTAGKEPSLSLQTTVDQPRRRMEIGASPAAQNPTGVFPLLMEHGEERDGTWSVQAPLTILVRRGHLLPDEAATVLAKLVELEYVTGAAPWDRITLVKTDGIAKIMDRLHGPRTQNKDQSDHAKRLFGRTASHRAVRSDQIAPSDALLAGLPSARPVATYGEIYADLLKRSYDIKGERVIGGARPSLQIRFKLSQEQALETLKWFEANGHVRQKDEWRTIVLVSDAVESTEGPARNAKQGGKLVMAPRPSAPPASTSTPPVRKSENPVSRPTVVSGGSSGATIARVEQALAEQRRQRQAIDANITKLEAMAAELKRVERSAAELLSSLGNTRDDS